MIEYAFLLFELFLFALPIIHPNIYVRMCIVIFYFISHQLKVQYYYVQFKKRTLANDSEIVVEMPSPLL